MGIGFPCSAIERDDKVSVRGPRLATVGNAGDVVGSPKHVHSVGIGCGAVKPGTRLRWGREPANTWVGLQWEGHCAGDGVRASDSLSPLSTDVEGVPLNAALRCM